MAKYHKWNDNKCVKCGLQRRKHALTKNMNTYGVGHYTYDYLVDDEWIPKNQPCEGKKVDDTDSNCFISDVIEELPSTQICYKTNEPCKHNCQGLCRESY